MQKPSTAYGSLDALEKQKADIKRSSVGAGDWVDPALPELPAEQNGSISTLGQIVNTMIGSGILAFPSVLAQVGLVYTVIAMTFFCSMVGASALMMIDAGQKIGVMDYSLIVERSLGRRWRLANDLSVFLSCMGALFSYVNVIGSLGMRVAEYIQPNGFTLINTYPGFMVVFTLVFAMPMNLRRSYGDLTYISACSLLFIVGATLVVGIGGPANSGVSHSIRMWPIAPLACLKYMGNFSYATSCQYVICEAHRSTTPESKGSFRLVMWAASAVGGFLLVAMGMAGYMAFGESVSSNVMLSFSPGLLSCLGQSLVVVHLLAYIPNDFIMMRFYGCKLFDVNILQVPAMQYTILSLFMFAVPLLSMAFIPLADVSGAFELVLDLTGDMPTGFQCFLLPGLVYLSTFREDVSGMHVAAVMTAIIGAVCMLVCPFIDIMSFVSACRSKQGCGSY